MAPRKTGKDRSPHLHVERMEMDLVMLDQMMQARARVDRLVPAGWRSAHWETPASPPKEKISIRLDADMLEWFRGLGNGYQKRINTVLRCYMDAVLSQYLEPDNDYEPIVPKD